LLPWLQNRAFKNVISFAWWIKNDKQWLPSTIDFTVGMTQRARVRRRENFKEKIFKARYDDENVTGEKVSRRRHED
jgi:hypothetical protein